MSAHVPVHVHGSWRRPGPATRRLGLTVAGLALAIGATFVLEPYRAYQVAIVAAYLCATAGLTLLVGRGGQLSLGHAALMAAGAYGFGLSSNALSAAGASGAVRLVVPLAAGVLAAAALGALLGAAGARLRGPYLAGLTLAVVVAVPAITSTFSRTLGGDRGLWIEIERRPDALRPWVGAEQWQAWVAITAAALVLLVLGNLASGSAGRQIAAVRDDEAAARLAGIDVTRVKVVSFTLSAAAAGLGGAVLAYVTQIANPGAYSLVFSLFLVVAVVIGGLGSLAGAFWGALLLVALPEATTSIAETLPVSPTLAQRLEGNLALLVFGLLLIVLMIVAPRGIHGALARARGALRRRWSARGPAPAPAPVPEGAAARAPTTG
ncbi:branched-chain amino acid ABC transporter permease [Cellulomonas chengniuliangii]|uniref:Branched-chain amino acid ABC transporter permease n=1 Tax=Cellulomonas chengniuliangii TaxID=2968084 RepID=A0ABY5L0G0_9CELL|nr:branched-chain amino acid ABC transporter permease [Cellulomonas chengniuliangii]MCC2309817.1 branched-chain amino acid ABC transporter permease [Cellulomonas chengniuliangii]UUI76261.1 branched-chain amino acid ABC transporter permease [Cellulomonas chengniuliangii]